MTDRQTGAASGTAADIVATQLMEMLATGAGPGSQLPSEAELAERFAVSRLTVREAVKILSGRGLLEVSRGKRAVVREPDGSALADFLGLLVRDDPKGLFDLIQVRLALETTSAGLAARRPSRAALQSLETALLGMKAAAGRASSVEGSEAEKRFHEFDLQFHEALATASGNRLLAFLFEAMRRTLLSSFGLSRHGQRLRGSIHADTVAAHQLILDAVRGGDEAGARAAMQAHLLSTERDIRAHFRIAPERGPV